MDQLPYDIVDRRSSMREQDWQDLCIAFRRLTVVYKSAAVTVQEFRKLLATHCTVRRAPCIRRLRGARGRRLIIRQATARANGLKEIQQTP